MKLPQNFIDAIRGLPGLNLIAFQAAHENPAPVTSVRLNPARFKNFPAFDTGNGDLNFLLQEPVPWCSTGFYLHARPSFTFDPLFHAGCYYVQEASSMFLEQALKQLTDLSAPLRLLDLAAAPGGKTTHLLSLINSNSLLVSNEVIKSRLPVLRQNVMKWGLPNVVVTHNDPSSFLNLEDYFDVMMVDAPCSGSGLFRRDARAVEAWSPAAVQLCSQRQQRILADALPALKQDGLLIYSTCSYSMEEDEAIADWLVKEAKMENLKLKIDAAWGIVETESEQTKSAGYRFYPDRLKGEGFYLSCFRKTTAGNQKKLKTGKKDLAPAKTKFLLKNWIKDEGLEFLNHPQGWMALPANLLADYFLLQSALNVQYAGVRLGQMMKEKVVPDHALALSVLVREDLPATELNYDQAIQYLQKNELQLQPAAEGWQLVRYKNQNLGWINALKNRINNYYPKELRILKQHNDAGFTEL